MTMLRSLYLTLMALTAFGCAAFRETPPSAPAPFPLNASYVEIQADPGRVVVERIARKKERGESVRFNEPFPCAFVDLHAKEVWLSRDMKCDWPKNRRHENCHIIAFESGVKDECHDGRSFR